MNNYFKKYTISKGLLSRWWIASIILSALLVTSCKTTKKNTSIHVLDSLAWNRKVSVTLATIPTSLAELTIPADSLRNLTTGAVYTAKNGQATVTAKREGNDIKVSAQCDSIQQRNIILEEELIRIRDQLRQGNKEQKSDIFSFWMDIKCYLTGALFGIVLLIIFQYIKHDRNS